MGIVKKLFSVLVLVLCAAVASAQGAQTVGVERVRSRPGVKVPLFTVWQSGAVATLVLFSGGAGGYGKLGDDGWPAGNNFLIRTGRLWAAHPFNVVMVGRPSDGIDLGDGAVRIDEKHAVDNLAIFKALKAKSPLPIWLVGTSMGTISAAAAAIRDVDGLIAGVVLTSSVTAGRIPGSVPSQDLARIRVPVLVVHHARDACRVCVPQDAGRIVAGLSQAPRKELILIEAGTGATGAYCKALHFHGFIGAEQETVDGIARWIRQTPR